MKANVFIEEKIAGSETVQQLFKLLEQNSLDIKVNGVDDGKARKFSELFTGSYGAENCHLGNYICSFFLGKGAIEADELEDFANSEQNEEKSLYLAISKADVEQVPEDIEYFISDSSALKIVLARIESLLVCNVLVDYSQYRWADDVIIVKRETEDMLFVPKTSNLVLLKDKIGQFVGDWLKSGKVPGGEIPGEVVYSLIDSGALSGNWESFYAK